MDIQETYLRLLRQSIWGTVNIGADFTAGDSDWKSLFSLCQKQGTAPLIYNELLKHPKAVPSSLLLQMRQVCMQNMLAYEKKQTLMQQIWAALLQQGLHPVLLKGFALARLYPNPYLRTWGDLDIITPRGEYQLACDAICQAFPDTKVMADADEACKHFVAYIGNETVEHHLYGLAFHNPKDEAYYRQIEAEAIVNSEHIHSIGSETVSVDIPEATFNLFFTFAHAKEHLEGTGMPMKQLCDLALLAHHYRGQIDQIRLKEYLKHLSLLQLWHTVGWVVVKALELPKEEWPLSGEWGRYTARRGQRLLENVLAEGQCRPHGPAFWQEGYVAPRGGYIGRKLSTLLKRFQTLGMMWPYSPKLALHGISTAIMHGLTRTIHGK